MAELVTDNTLEFFAVELQQRAPGHGHDGVRCALAGGEGVDAALAGQYVQRGDGHVRGEGQLFHHVQAALFVGVIAEALDAPPAQALGDGFAAGGKLHPAHHGDQTDRRSHHHGHGERAIPAEGAEIALPAAAPHVQVVVAGEPHQCGHQHVHEHDDEERREGKEHDEVARVATRPFLLAEEVHGRRPPA